MGEQFNILDLEPMLYNTRQWTNRSEGNEADESRSSFGRVLKYLQPSFGVTIQAVANLLAARDEARVVCTLMMGVSMGALFHCRILLPSADLAVCTLATSHVAQPAPDY